MSSIKIFSLCSILISSVTIFGQIDSTKFGASDGPVMSGFEVRDKPVIDGEVLTESFWQKISPAGSFIQTRPYPRKPASEKTEVRIAYDQETFYVAFVCYDSDPSRLVITDARRDASLENTDAVLMILDTYNDGQNGFVFGTNPTAVEYDAQVDNEGQGNFNLNRQQGGIIGGFNLNWDASWSVKTKVGDFGWSAEFAIPFRTIRYRSGTNQSWGINFRRNIQKSNEIDYWSHIPINFDLNRLSLAGKLEGLNLKSPGNLKVIPYALLRSSKDFESVSQENEITADFGGDIKYSITPSLTLDLTYNTDFAQVEVDEQQVNLDRFNLFFPEKRPFFLENAGLFSVGSPGEVDLFFSRRIGIGDMGQIVPIHGGARLSGKLNKTNVGLLSMFANDADPDKDGERDNFTVVRVNHEFGNRTALGAVFVGRAGLGNASTDFNRTLALDGKIGLGQKARITGFLAKSTSPDIDDRDHSFKIRSEYNWNGWELSTAYTEVGEGFSPEVGFLLREAFRKPEFRVLYHWRMNGKLGFLELRPHVTYRSYWNFNGFQETRFLHIDNHWEWQNGLEIHTGINLTTEGVVEDFNIFEEIVVQKGSYEHSEAQLVFRTNRNKALAISTRHILGGFFGGKRYANSATLYLRIGDKFNSEYSLRRNDIDLPQGQFTTNVFGTRLSYSFTPRIYLQGLVQYNSVRDLWSSNFRFGWLNQANSGLFLVYNDVYGLNGIKNRSLTLKYSYLFDVIN